MSILVATDFSDTSRAALQTAVREAHRRSTSLTLVHCVDTLAERWDLLEEAPTDDEGDLHDAAAKHLRSFFEETIAREDRPAIEELRIIEDHASSGLQALESSESFELVVVGATGGGALSQFVLGSTAEEVVRSSSTPVLVVPRGDYEPIDRILAPVDLSDCSRASLLSAVELARREDAKLDIIHVTNLPTGAMLIMDRDATEDDRRKHREVRWQQFEEFIDAVELGDVDYETDLRFGEPALELVEYARENDIKRIVMGTHGRRGFERLFLGSTAAKILRRIPCPVMTIRHRED